MSKEEQIAMLLISLFTYVAQEEELIAKMVLEEGETVLHIFNEDELEKFESTVESNSYSKVIEVKLMHYELNMGVSIAVIESRDGTRYTATEVYTLPEEAPIVKRVSKAIEQGSETYG